MSIIFPELPLNLSPSVRSIYRSAPKTYLWVFLFFNLFLWDQSWVFIGKTNAEAETPILWPPDAKSWLIGKDPDAGRDWGQEEKGTTGWDGWMASLTQWKWVWVNSVSWWWTGRPGVLQFMGSQRVGHDWATELNWTVLTILDSSVIAVFA